MADDPSEFVKATVAATVSETAERVLESSIATGLLVPVATEMGQLMGTLGSAVRFYATDNLERICRRWSEARGKELSEESFKRVMPLLQSASMDSREEFTSKWATLLQSVVEDDDETTTFPSFGATLSQVSSLEARLLENLWQKVLSGEIEYSLEGIELEATWANFIQKHLYESRVKTDFNTNDVLDNFAKARAAIADSKRLGILQSTTQLASLKEGPTTDMDEASKGGRYLTDVYSFSSYGEMFMEAVTGAKKAPVSFTEEELREHERIADAVRARRQAERESVHVVGTGPDPR